MTCRQWLPVVREYCGQPARPYLIGAHCVRHTPAKQAGIDEPPSTPMEPR